MPPPPPNHEPQKAALSTAFLLTGVATAMLGVTLPVMLQQWNLNDASGGSLLLLAWGGSTCGAFLFRGNLRRSASVGLALTALALLSLAILNRSAALPFFAVYGVGLGIAMTAITLLVSRSASEASRRVMVMRLNLLWSIGACIAPTLAAHALTHTRVGGLFMALSLAFAVVAGSIVFGSRQEEATPIVAVTARLPFAPLTVYAMAFLAVGTESAIGGWLATYAGRTAHTELVTISATSAFWLGLLLSRALHSVSGVRGLHTNLTLVGHAAIATMATVVLLAAPHSAAFVPSAVLAGFGLGPLYPRILAVVVGNYRPRAVFTVAGIGSAALPWLTGTVSHVAGSLTSGMLVPCVAAAALLLLMVLMIKSLESQPFS